MPPMMKKGDMPKGMPMKKGDMPKDMPKGKPAAKQSPKQQKKGNK